MTQARQAGGSSACHTSLRRLGCHLHTQRCDGQTPESQTHLACAGLYVRTPNATTPYQQPPPVAGFDGLPSQGLQNQDLDCPALSQYVGSYTGPTCHVIGNLSVRAWLFPRCTALPLSGAAVVWRAVPGPDPGVAEPAWGCAGLLDGVRSCPRASLARQAMCRPCVHGSLDVQLAPDLLSAQLAGRPHAAAA